MPRQPISTASAEPYSGPRTLPSSWAAPTTPDQRTAPLLPQIGDQRHRHRQQRAASSLQCPAGYQDRQRRHIPQPLCDLRGRGGDDRADQESAEAELDHRAAAESVG
jgi:hypothetical protein